MNTGREYELLVEKTLKVLFQEKGRRFDGAIRRNAVMKGLSGATHELDLVLEFCWRNRQWHIAVECKDRARPVEKEVIASFRTKLNDVNARRKSEKRLTGFVASSNGFQSGAVTLARYCRLGLMELCEPGENEWEKYIRRFVREGKPSGLRDAGLSLRTNEQIRIFSEAADTEGGILDGTGSWDLNAPLGKDPYSITLRDGKNTERTLMEFLDLISMEDPGKEKGVRRRIRLKTPGARLYHMVYDQEMQVREIEFIYDDLTQEAKNAVLYPWEKPDVVLRFTGQGQRLGIWNKRVFLLPDPVEEIKTGNADEVKKDSGSPGVRKKSLTELWAEA